MCGCMEEIPLPADICLVRGRCGGTYYYFELNIIRLFTGVRYYNKPPLRCMYAFLTYYKRYLNYLYRGRIRIICRERFFSKIIYVRSRRGFTCVRHNVLVEGKFDTIVNAHISQRALSKRYYKSRT